MLTLIDKIIRMFRKEYYLYYYQGKGNKSNYIQTFKARNMRNALAAHLNTYFPVEINMENFNLEDEYSELVIYYNFELDGEIKRYIMIKDKVFDMYYQEYKGEM